MSSLGYGNGPSAHTNLEYLWAITCQVHTAQSKSYAVCQYS